MLIYIFGQSYFLIDLEHMSKSGRYYYGIKLNLTRLIRRKMHWFKIGIRCTITTDKTNYTNKRYFDLEKEHIR